LDSCDILETLLDQADTEFSKAKKESGNKKERFMRVNNLKESLLALSPKIDDLGNEYCFAVKQINSGCSGMLSDRVKTVIHKWKTLISGIEALKSELESSMVQEKFVAVYDPAISFIEEMIRKVRNY